MIHILLRIGLVLLLLFNAWMSPVLAETIEETQILQVIRSHPKDILDSLIAYQQEQDFAKIEARAQVVRSVTENPRSLIAQSPKQGNLFSQKTIVEFSDFQCPFCAKAHEELNQFTKQHPDVQVVYKHLPLIQIHDQAMPAAKAAWAAAKQGKFWEYHDQLFANQEHLGEPLYETIAQDLNLNVDQFNHDRASKSAMAAIEADLKWADQLGATGTPFYVLVGPKDTQLLTGASLKDLEATIEQV
jgi:protein-disulfide isomerase